MKHANDFDFRIARITLRGIKEGINVISSDLHYFEKIKKGHANHFRYKRILYLLESRRMASGSNLGSITPTVGEST